MKKKIIITGISSQLMREFSQTIDFSKYEVYGISRKAASFSLNNVILLEADIQDLSLIDDVFMNADIIIHGAAVTHSMDSKSYYTVNTEGTQKLVDMAIKHQIVKFVLISSNTASLTGGAYAKSKYLAEQIVINQCQNYLILRPSEIFGGIKNEGIDQLIKDAFCKSIMVIPKGMKYEMRPIYIHDVINLFDQFIFSNSEQNYIQSITGNDSFSIGKIVQMISQIRKRQITQIQIPKFMMQLIKQILIRTRMNVGIVPDQIDRLYGPKSYAHDLKIETSFESYLKSYSESY